MSALESLFAQISDDPLTCAFAEEKKSMPSIDRSKKPVSAPYQGAAFEAFAEQAYLENIDRPLALYLHVPFCRHRCSFCPFFINLGKKGFSAHYSALLAKEIDATVKVLRPVIDRRAVNAVYFGGGTPSDLESEDLALIIEKLYQSFPMAKDVEFTVEGRVNGFSKEKGERWVKAGANRFSLGVQTTDTQLRRRLGRLDDRSEIKKVLNSLSQSGASVLVDLMYGLPGQTIEMLVDDVRFLSEETDIHGLDLYVLKLFPDSPMEKAITRGAMSAAADFSMQAEMFRAAHQKLLDAGFENFAEKHWRRDTRERSVYNCLAKAQGDIIPFGSGAGGRFGALSMGNTGLLSEYEELVMQGKKPLKRIMASPLKSQTNLFAYELESSLDKLTLPEPSRWPNGLQDQVTKLMRQWQAAGLVQVKNERDWVLTCAGVFWIQRIRRLLLDFVAAPVL